MKPYTLSARVTLYACRAVAAGMLLLLFTFPMLTELYHRHCRTLVQIERVAIIGGFYACSGAVLLALWNMDCLLRNILKGQLFVSENVSYIRRVRWCCASVSVLCLVAGIGFPALIFLAIIMAFLSLAVTVVGQVMKAGVEIREENDLTV